MSDPPPELDTPAIYLAKCLVADKGYVPGTFVEAARLAEASDVVLTGGDGVGLVIACIMDRDRDPARRFTLPPEVVDEVGAACRHHVGSVYGAKAMVSIEIWEVGAGVPDAGDRARLEQYTFRKLTRPGVQVKTYAVNTAPGAVGDVVSTAADGLKREPWIRKILKEPRRSPEQLAAAARQHEKVARFHRRPVATLALLAAFLAMFVVSLVWTVLPAAGFLTPSIGTQVSLGALEHGRVDAGEWWRLLTCAFLHGGPMHLVFNGIAMYMAGGVLENLVGRAWMLALFVVGAVGGSLASMAINPANVISVGASGAIMALLAAAMVVSLRLPAGPARNQILISLGYILLPSLLPLAAGSGARIDYGAHVGGAITGAVTGALVLLTWARDSESPRAGKLAAAIATAGLLFAGYGFAKAASDHDMYRETYAAAARANPRLFKELVPEDQFPEGPAEIAAEIPDLLERYPRDPRVRFFAGLVAHDAGRHADAIAHFEALLSDGDMLALLTDPAGFELQVRYYLAQTLEANDQAARARDALAPSCARGTHAPDGDVRAYYQRLCAP